jgi:hypothetical protein
MNEGKGKQRVLEEIPGNDSSSNKGIIFNNFLKN